MIPVEKVSDGRLHAPANNTAARNRYRNFIVYFLIKKADGLQAARFDT